MSIINVNVDELPESDTIPSGEYAVRIDGVSDVKEDKNGIEFVKLEFTVIDGEFTNRKVFENYVPLSGSSKLRKILKASDFNGSNLTDTDDLIGLEVGVIVKVTKSDAFPDSNSISHYMTKKQEKPNTKKK